MFKQKKQTNEILNIVKKEHCNPRRSSNRSVRILLIVVVVLKKKSFVWYMYTTFLTIQVAHAHLLPPSQKPLCPALRHGSNPQLPASLDVQTCEDAAI